MKRWLTTLILLIFTTPPALALAGSEVMVVGGGGGCATQKDTADDESLSTYVFSGASSEKAAVMFTAASSFTACKLEANVCYYETDPAVTITAMIYDNNATPEPDEPGSVIANGTADNTVNSRQECNGHTRITFNWANGPSLSSSTVYWIVLSGDDNGSWLRWLYTSNESGPSFLASDDESDWTQDKEGSYNYRLYSQ